MKKLSLVCNALCAITLFVLVSCESEFIYDPLDPRLPKYSEDGNNVAGAYFNDAVWRSKVSYNFNWTGDKPYIYSYPNGDSLLFVFEGDKGYIVFKVNNIEIRNIEDFKAVSGRKIRFDNSEGMARIESYYGQDILCQATQIGQLYLKSIKQKRNNNTLIVSGTFGFRSDENSAQNIDVTYGRFDYTFNLENNFFIQQ